jgi:hypothetical protein
LAFHSGCDANHSPRSSGEVKEWVELYLYSPNTPSWRGAQLRGAQGQLYLLPLLLPLNETYKEVRIGKSPIQNGLKQGDYLSPFHFNFALECAIRNAQISGRNGMEHMNS